MLAVTQYITSSFHVARSKYRDENRRWIDASGALAGRVGIMPMVVNIQRAGEIDLVLRAMEDEFLPAAPDEMFAVHYQLMLSEA